MSWTDERIALLKRMWKEGKSAADIAKTLGKGVTRNAVIGKAHRMGLSGRPSPIKKPAATTAKKEPAATKKEAASPKKSAPVVSLPSKSKVTAPFAKAEVDELKKIEKDIVQIGGGVALIDLTERMCKWPIGDPREADFSFCGRNIRPGTPYCLEHAAMAYQSSSRSRNAAAAAAAAAAVDDKEEEEVDVADTEDTEDEE